MVSEVAQAVRVVVVDDHPVVREGLCAMFHDAPGIAVVGAASEGEGAIELATRLEPDVVLMDIRMPGMSGIEALRRIKALRPCTAVIIITMYDTKTYLLEALGAGATGYLVKDSPVEIFCHAIHAAMGGYAVVKGDLLRQAIQGILRGGAEAGSQNLDSRLAQRLTPRELDVLRLVARGCLNKEIAKELSLAEVTVKKYVQSIMAKLAVSDRTNVALSAVRLGLVE